MAFQTTLFRPWAVGQVTPTSHISALHPRPWLPSPFISSPVRSARDPGTRRTLTTYLLNRIDQVLVRCSLWMLSLWFLCVARLAVFACSVCGSCIWLKICCGLARIFMWLACARGQIKALSINQEVPGTVLMQHMQHADAHSCLAA